MLRMSEKLVICLTSFILHRNGLSPKRLHLEIALGNILSKEGTLPNFFFPESLVSEIFFFGQKLCTLFSR